MLLLTQRKAGIDCCDPFVEILKKCTAVHKYRSHVIVCNILFVAVRNGKYVVLVINNIANSCHLFQWSILLQNSCASQHLKSEVCAYRMYHDHIG